MGGGGVWMWSAEASESGEGGWKLWQRSECKGHQQEDFLCLVDDVLMPQLYAISPIHNIFLFIKNLSLFLSE